MFLVVKKVFSHIPCEVIAASGTKVTLLHHQFVSILTETSHSITQLTVGSKKIRVRDVKMELESAAANRLGLCAAHWRLAEKYLVHLT